MAVAPAARAAEPIAFRNPCAKGDRLVIAAVGDLLFHRQLQMRALVKGKNYRQFWAPVAELLASADLTYGNLEGPTAAGVAAGGRLVKDPGRRMDGRVYSDGRPQMNFNFHPSVIDDLKASGFDILSTANNHAFDRGAIGIDKTADALDAAAMPFSGTRKRDEFSRPWSAVTRANGFRIAWLACTFDLNGFKDRHGQALFCYDEQEQVLAEIRVLASRPDIDAVILTPHWGQEGSHVADGRQKSLAKAAIEAGAAAVIGTHPHVLQPWSVITTDDGRDGLVIYSTGNFVSNQRRLPERSGIIAIIELTREAGNKARVTAARFVPTWVVIDGAGHRVVEMGKAGSGGALASALRILPGDNRIGARDAIDRKLVTCGS